MKVLIVIFRTALVLHTDHTGQLYRYAVLYVSGWKMGNSVVAIFDGHLFNISAVMFRLTLI